MELIFATHNQHKLEEVRDMLPGNYQISSLAELGLMEEIAETADTLSGNAEIKARAIYDLTGKNVFADDSGLEVPSLDMRPGVITARYAGVERDAIANMTKVLKELEGSNDRTARFRACFAMIINGQLYETEGVVNGQIAPTLQGEGGFGYDPIFIPYGYSQSFAELSSELKNGMSHRYRALMGIRKILEGIS